MSAGYYDLKFSVAGRNLFKKRLRVVHCNGSSGDSLQDFSLENLPTTVDKSADGFILHSIEDDGEIPDIFKFQDKLAYVLQRYPRHVTEIRGSFDEFLGSLSSKTRSTLRRKVRKFSTESSNGTIDWRKYTSADEVCEFFNLVGPLAERTYQARLLDSALPSTEDFKTKAIEAAAQGNLAAYLLFLNGSPIAYLYTPRAGDTYFYDYLGYDENFAQLSPGTVLQFLVHERLFNEGCISRFDFTEGDGAHKRLFSNHSRMCATVLVVNYTPFNNLLVHSHRHWERIVSRFKKYLQKFDMHTKFRKLVRHRRSALQ